MEFNEEYKFLKQKSEPINSTLNKNLHYGTVESISLDGKRIVLTFKLPKQGGESFVKSFKYSCTIINVRDKLAKLLNMTTKNIILAQDKNQLPDNKYIAELTRENNQPIVMFTKDNTFVDVEMLNEKFDEKLPPIRKEVSKSVQKTVPELVTCKFNVVKQYHTFTKYYASCKTMSYVFQDICSTFLIDKTKLVMINDQRRLEEDDIQLSELVMDNFGNIEIKLFTNDGSKLKFEMLYKDAPPISDILTVTVKRGECSFVRLNVEIIDAKIVKPYLGGYRNKNTGVHYHHAFTQTPQRKEKVPPEKKNSRKTQTIKYETKATEVKSSRSTQMTSPDVYIPCITDVFLTPKPYESYEQMMARLNHQFRALIIQRAWRAYKFRVAVRDWLDRCMKRIRDLEEERLEELKLRDTRLRQDVVKKTYPRTREDFDQLYAMVDRWRNAEIARITKLHSKGPRIAEFCLILDKEIEMLRSIEKYRTEVREDNVIIKETNLLEEMSKPTVWTSKTNGLVIEMDTLGAQRSRYLKDLYFSFGDPNFTNEERMKRLADFLNILKEYDCPLATELKCLIDRECELIVRNVSKPDLEMLRKRIQATLFKFMLQPEFNQGALKRVDEKNTNNMINEKLFLCKECRQVKTYKDFPLHTRTEEMNQCISCSWGNMAVDTNPDFRIYCQILRSVQREERRTHSWSSVAFIFQDADIYYLVEKIWHSRSIISESFDLQNLRMCRWNKDKDWSPWNCILLTVKEMRAHMRLDDPEASYDSNLIESVKNKHLLAKAKFSSILGDSEKEPETSDREYSTTSTTSNYYYEAVCKKKYKFEA